jgi:LytS/YehU family sensor histidine kinase
MGHAYLQIKIGEKYSWLEQPLKRFILVVIEIVVYSILAYGIVQTIINLIVIGKLPHFITSFNLSYWSFPVALSFFIALFISAISFFKSWKKEVYEKQKIENEMLTYKYEALRNQINPHFMFNSLNVLTDLVYEDKKKAVEFIYKFSDIYRYVLDSRDKELVPIEDELTFIDKYVFLLKTRFEDKLIIEINVKPQPNELIVPLALQLLIENAVKHNEISTKNKLVVEIKKENDNYIVVSNPIQPKSIGDISIEIGLKNLKQQYLFFTDNEVLINKDNNVFSVKIPIIIKT